MAYSLDNKCAKNCCKWTVLVHLIIEDVVACFFGTQRSIGSVLGGIFNIAVSFLLVVCKIILH